MAEAYVDARRPVSTFITSAAGRAFIVGHEAQPGVSNHLHHPTAGSGVTLGPGYDFKDRSRGEVAADLEAVGVPSAAAAAAALGAGLTGARADTFVKDHRALIDLTQAQQVALLSRIVGSYERRVRRAVTADLNQHEFDALVSYAYNPGGGWTKVTTLVNAGKPTPAMDALSLCVFSKGQRVKSLVVRRRAERDMFLRGIYR